MIIYAPKKRSIEEYTNLNPNREKIKQIYEKYLKNEWEKMSYISSCKKSFNRCLLVKFIKALLHIA